MFLNLVFLREDVCRITRKNKFAKKNAVAIAQAAFLHKGNIVICACGKAPIPMPECRTGRQIQQVPECSLQPSSCLLCGNLPSLRLRSLSRNNQFLNPDFLYITPFLNPSNIKCFWHMSSSVVSFQRVSFANVSNVMLVTDGSM